MREQGQTELANDSLTNGTTIINPTKRSSISILGLPHLITRPSITWPGNPHNKQVIDSFRWTRLSCRKFRDKKIRLQLHALAYNLATFLRCIELHEAMADWSLTSLQLKLIKIGARVVRHARAITFQLAEVAVTGPMVRVILAAVHRVRAPPLCA
jgi:hypothetical protein